MGLEKMEGDAADEMVEDGREEEPEEAVGEKVRGEVERARGTR
jgi:hypothetical protein